MTPDTELLQRVNAAGDGGMEVREGSPEHDRAKRMARPDALLAWILHREEQIDPRSRLTRSRFFVRLTPRGHTMIESTGLP